MTLPVVYIASAARTPIGAFNGCLSTLRAHELGAVAIREALSRVNIDGCDVSEVILGQVLTSNQGQNPARQASLQAGIPISVPAWGINMLCGSGLKAVILGAQAIQSGHANIVVAGGQESMTQAPHVISLRTSESKLGDASLVDTVLRDGLVDVFENCHMGVTAENVAKDYSISRQEQDKMAACSQERFAQAKAAGYIEKEMISVIVKKKKETTVVENDEHPRPNSSVEVLSKLRSAFIADGTVTAGNASGINDGAAAVVLLSELETEKRGIKPMAKIITWAQAGVEPRVMGMGPVPAIKMLLERAGWSIEDVDLFEINEAFAASSIAVARELGADVNKINIHGGAIALGHPLGASGTRVLVTLLYALQATGKKKGVVALCIGGGMGIAMGIEMV